MFSGSASQSLLKFGSGIVAVGILGQIAKNFDYLVVGGKIGATALGFYFLAFRLPELVVLGMFQVANEVLFPFYARLREAATGMPTTSCATATCARSGSRPRSRCRPDSAWLRSRYPSSSCCTARSGESPPLPLAFVAVWSALASLAALPGVVFKATGRSWLLTSTGVAADRHLLPAIWIAADHGIAAVAAAQVVEKTLSLAILGVFVGKVLRHPVVHDLHAAAPLLRSRSRWPPRLPLASCSTPALALAVANPDGLRCCTPCCSACSRRTCTASWPHRSSAATRHLIIDRRRAACGETKRRRSDRDRLARDRRRGFAAVFGRPLAVESHIDCRIIRCSQTDAIAALADRLPPAQLRRERGDLSLLNRGYDGCGHRAAVGDGPCHRPERFAHIAAGDPEDDRVRGRDRGLSRRAHVRTSGIGKAGSAADRATSS